MDSTSRIAANLRAFQMAVNAHDRENPTHTTLGLGLSAFDMDRLGLEEGELILPGVPLSVIDEQPGIFRVLCDGQHDSDRTEQAQQAEPVRAVSTRSVSV